MKIKVCGMRNIFNLKELVSLSPDYIGFIFYNKSKRYIGEELDEKLDFIPAEIKKVGVFVNADKSYIQTTIKNYNLDMIQLHGDEPPELCADLSREIQVIKAFGVSKGFDFNSLKDYQSCCSYFLFDTKTDSYGGSGESYDWSLLDDYKLDTHFFLSGGIGELDIDKIKKYSHPFFYAIDLNSKFETEPGLKDIERLKKFKNEIQG